MNSASIFICCRIKGKTPGELIKEKHNPTQIMVHQEHIHLSTTNHGDMHDLTKKVNAIVKNSGIKTGMVHIFNIGSTAAVGTIEFEPGLQRDLPEILNKLIPPSREYGHEQMWHDGNVQALTCKLPGLGLR